jgi:CHU_C Type IX secretion signal domain
MKRLFLSSLCLSLLSLFNCNGQEVEPPKSTVYEACCGAEPVEFTNQKAYMFVPNVFTPNGDRKNDYFSPFHNEEILGFSTYMILTPVGDTVLYATTEYNPKNIENTAWNGLRDDGKVYKGLFKYRFTVFLKGGAIYRVEGQACRVVCGPEAKVFLDKKGCFYPLQADTTGRLSKDTPSQEAGCFD